MQFSISKLLIGVAFASFVLAATFAMPASIGFPVLTVTSLVVVPPFVLVGLVNTRGLRQSFFIGAAVAGVYHFIFSLYEADTLGFGFGDVQHTDADIVFT